MKGRNFGTDYEIRRKAKIEVFNDVEEIVKEHLLTDEPDNYSEPADIEGFAIAFNKLRVKHFTV